MQLRHPGPITACVDATRLRQLLSNLVGNALQHSPPGEPIVIDLDDSDNHVRLQVTNGGPPIDADIAELLFCPFAHHERRRPRDRLGLGLFIASEIARSHGGTIEARTNSQGTSFTTLIPRAKAQ